MKVIRDIGLPYKVYTSHSFRISRASDLSSKGTSNVNVIKKTWKMEKMQWMDIHVFAIRTC